MFQILLSSINCKGNFAAPDQLWMRAGYVCFSGSHLLLVVLAVMLALGFAALAAVFSFVFVDSNPLSPDLYGTASGRAALDMLIWKVRA